MLVHMRMETQTIVKTSERVWVSPYPPVIMRSESIPHKRVPRVVGSSGAAEGW